MKPKHHRLLSSLVVLIACSLSLAHCRLLSAATRSETEIERLRCESLENPLGIDEVEPQLSWILKSNSRGSRQTAYQVVVALTPERLDGELPDLWDSGKVSSNNSTAITYAGKPLTSEHRCYWKVRVWDREDEPSDWSKTAVWSMGLLDPQDWTARWIGCDAKRTAVLRDADLDGSKWICHADDTVGSAPQGHRLYTATFALPEGAVVDSAEVLAIADDKLWMAVNGKMIVHGEPGWQRVKPVSIAQVLKPGSNEVRFNVKNESLGPTGLLVQISISLNNGEKLEVQSEESWLSSKSPGQHWPSEPLDESDFTPCQVIGSYGIEPWGKAQLQDLFLPPVPLLRTEFEVSKQIESATLYVTALGICDAYLNGQRVSDHFFTPGWTDYTQRTYYRTYDVTELVRSGENALGGQLADGWFSGYIGWGRNRNHYGEKPRLKMQLNLRYADGTSDVVATGPEWKATSGPTYEADFLMGESYDARLALPGWNQPRFPDSDWQAVDVGSEFSTHVESSSGPPVRVVREFKPVAITEPRAGVHIFDLGQNFAGVVRLQVAGKAGQQIQLRFAERLNPDGTLYTTNLRGARTIDRYICRGEAIEVWQPRFTFHGLQFVEVTGLSGPPTTDTVTGIALSSDTPRVGWFECSDSTLNQLHNNILWTQYANFIDIPTDCPQRDERLGWTGDAQVYVATACLNTDVQAFFAKWLVDLSDAQREDGQFPMVAPLKVAGDDGGPAWADAGVICPWTIYQVYEDRRLLERQYPSMKRFVEFCRQRSKDSLLPPDEFHCFGDWLNIDADTPRDVIYSAYFAHSTRLLARAAKVLGRKQEAAKYQQLFEQIKSAFNDAYVDADGRVKGETQCSYVLALANDLLDGKQKQQAAEHLVANIADRNYHLSTGFVGTKDLMLVLSKIGRNDMAYRLIHNETFPSWGFSIKHGATSIWERWDGWTPGKGFQDPGMNSFAHYSFGAVYQWMVENIGGIRLLEPGYKHFMIAPHIGGNLTWAKTEYESIHGRIISHWRLSDDRLHLDVAVPANTTAEVHLPTRQLADVRIDGENVDSASPVASSKIRNGVVIIRIDSGSYSFEVNMEK